MDLEKHMFTAGVGQWVSGSQDLAVNLKQDVPRQDTAAGLFVFLRVSHPEMQISLQNAYC